MTADEYVAYILKRYEASILAVSSANSLKPALRDWAGPYLQDIFFSGSYAKGTAVKGTTDIDLFISLSSRWPGKLENLYEELFAYAQQRGWSPRRQNVSIGVTQYDTKIDLVPGRVQPGYLNYHSLYRRRTGTWIQTNVKEHIAKVANSKRTDAIRAIKIWRNCHNLDFPSFYLELIVLRALHGMSNYSLSSNVTTTLEYIASSLPSARVEDPANTNNIVSDDLTPAEKSVVARVADSSLQKEYWHEVLW